MSLTQEKITSLKKLTALRSGENLSIESVLASFDTLSELPIDTSQNPSRSGQDVLIAREDCIHPSSASRESLLDCSPQKVVGKQIALARIIHEE